MKQKRRYVIFLLGKAFGAVPVMELLFQNTKNRVWIDYFIQKFHL
nr:unnamed protein product [Callosobruchus chinensis]